MTPMGTHVDEISTLRIGVTGHRELEPSGLSKVRALVQDALEQVINSCQPARVELVTGMADGADQMVADVALALGCRIHIALPKPVNEYRTELSVEGRQRLDELTSEADARVSVVEGGPAEAGEDLGEATPYRNLGDYLARSCHLLIALWDGQIDRNPGGTLDVLATHLDRVDGHSSHVDVPITIGADDDAEDRPGPTAIWIDASRSTSASSGSPRARFLVGSGVPGVWRAKEQLPVGLGGMLDALGAAAVAAADNPESEPGYPLCDQLPDNLDPARREALEEIHDAYLTADRLAIRHQSRSDRAFIGTSLIAAAMGFSFLWFAKIDDHLAWLYAYLVLFASGYFVFRVARSRHWLRHHLSMRVLAETLRVRFFTTMLGIADEVDTRRVLTLTGVSSFPGFEWVAEADRIGVPTKQDLPAELASRSEFVREKWVDDQAGYFERKIKQLRARHERLEMVQRVLYVLSFLAAVVIIIYGYDLKKVYAPGHVSVKTILIFSMGLLPLWLTFWELHQSRMATRELLWQYRNQAMIFRRASVQLHDVATDAVGVKLGIYRELAERSLFETYLWTIHRFHREFTPPSGG
jgi:hypothetical protein